LIKDGNWQKECCNECPELVKLLKEFDEGFFIQIIFEYSKTF